MAQWRERDGLGTLRGMLSSHGRDAFERDGYVIVRGLFSASEVAALAAGFDRLRARVRGHGPGEVELDGARFVLGAPLPGSAEPVIRRVVWCGAAEPELLRLGRVPRLLRLAATLLRSRSMVHIIHQAHEKRPGDGVAFGWHQDAVHRRYGTPLWTDVGGRGAFVEIAAAVDPMSQDNGGLCVVPGSHRRGYLTHHDGVLPAPEAPRALTLAPGDAVAFGPFLIHGSEANRGVISRRTFLNGFALPGANRRVYPGCGTGELVQAPGDVESPSPA